MSALITDQFPSEQKMNDKNFQAQSVYFNHWWITKVTKIEIIKIALQSVYFNHWWNTKRT